MNESEQPDSAEPMIPSQPRVEPSRPAGRPIRQDREDDSDRESIRSENTSSMPVVWIVGGVTLLGFCVFVPLMLLVAIAAITALGTSANSTFSVVGTATGR